MQKLIEARRLHLGCQIERGYEEHDGGPTIRLSARKHPALWCAVTELEHGLRVMGAPQLAALVRDGVAAEGDEPQAQSSASANQEPGHEVVTVPVKAPPSQG